MNDITRNLTSQHYFNFLRSFDDSKKIYWNDRDKRLIHPGEFGTYREDLVKKWLRIVVPENFGIGSGFIIGPKGSISTQVDIIIYDKTRSPIIENLNQQRFYPVETVCCIGEIKSDINSKSELNLYLQKLANVKRIRWEVQVPEPYRRENWALPYSNDITYDNLFSFLIYRKLRFGLDQVAPDYGDTPHSLHHNMALSLEDGILLYHDVPNNTMVPYSKAGQKIKPPLFVKSDTDPLLPSHIQTFLAYLQQGINKTTLLNMDIITYLTDDYK